MSKFQHSYLCEMRTIPSTWGLPLSCSLLFLSFSHPRSWKTPTGSRSEGVPRTYPSLPSIKSESYCCACCPDGKSCLSLPSRPLILKRPWGHSKVILCNKPSHTWVFTAVVPALQLQLLWSVDDCADSGVACASGAQKGLLLQLLISSVQTAFVQLSSGGSQTLVADGLKFPSCLLLTLSIISKTLESNIRPNENASLTLLLTCLAHLWLSETASSSSQA